MRGSQREECRVEGKIYLPACGRRPNNKTKAGGGRRGGTSKGPGLANPRTDRQGRGNEQGGKEATRRKRCSILLE